ncbi:hypothetical protein [Kineosporia mesophila]|nr:hypothetical protein [Kineosporia mesophila]
MTSILFLLAISATVRYLTISKRDRTEVVSGSGAVLDGQDP